MTVFCMHTLQFHTYVAAAALEIFSTDLVSSLISPQVHWYRSIKVSSCHSSTIYFGCFKRSLSKSRSGCGSSTLKIKYLKHIFTLNQDIALITVVFQEYISLISFKWNNRTETSLQINYILVKHSVVETLYIVNKIKEKEKLIS